VALRFPGPEGVISKQRTNGLDFPCLRSLRWRGVLARSDDHTGTHVVSVVRLTALSLWVPVHHLCVCSLPSKPWDQTP